jgi:hypothetical protein
LLHTEEVLADPRLPLITAEHPKSIYLGTPSRETELNQDWWKD